MLRFKWTWGLAVALVLLMTVYVNQMYFFNPLTFKQDEVTYLPWKWYEKPLQIEYLVMGPDGWHQKVVNDADEIRFVLDEIKKGGPASPETLAEGAHDERRLIIDIRHLEDGPNAPGGIVSHSEWAVAQDVLLSGSAKKPFGLTQELRQLLEKRMGQAMEEERKE